MRPDADEAEGLAAELGALQLLLEPLALLHGGVGLGDVVGHGDHQSEGQLGDREARGLGRIVDRDALGLRVVDVDRVDSDAAADHVLELGRRVDHRLVDLGLGADDDDLGLGDATQVRRYFAEALEPRRKVRRESVG